MKNKNVVELPTEGSAALQLNDKKEKQKTNKKFLNRAEKIVRKLDNALSELNDVSADLGDFSEGAEFATTEVADRDYDRVREMNAVVNSCVVTLYHLTNRMSRKYVGKEVDDVDGRKRKALKV